MTSAMRLPSSPRRPLLRSRPKRRGATTVEMAFVAPIFLLLVFGIVEFGRAVMVVQSLTEAARAGARCAALATTRDAGRAEEAVRTYFRQTMTSSFDMNQCRITITPSGLEGLASGSEITAEVEVDVDDVSWIVPSFLANRVLRGEASMTRE